MAVEPGADGVDIILCPELAVGEGLGPACLGEREGKREGGGERSKEVVGERGGGEAGELGTESSEFVAELGPLGLEVMGLGD